MTRVIALLAKEMAELRRSPALLLPAVLTGGLAILIPFFVAVMVPAATGERLSDSSDFQVALDMYRNREDIGLDPEAAVQAWIFHRFLVLLVITPLTGSMSIAAASVISEKQARSLEPLLATPITTAELLAAKVLASFIPAALLGLLSFVIYLAGTVLFARPGVWSTLMTPDTLLIVGVAVPLTALAALQLTVCVSSRVNDARTAQQFGALVLLPVMVLMLAQVLADVVLGGRLLGAIVLGLLLVNAILAKVGLRLFEREVILTKWT